MKDFRNRLPLMFAVSFAVAIAILAYIKLASWHGIMRVAGAAFLTIYVLWLFLESRVAVTETKKGATRVDRGTCEAYAFGRALTVLTALGLPTWWTEPGMWTVLGLLILVGGVTFRLVAIRTLGDFYSHRVRVLGDHQVIQHGPYQWVRHPAYTGMLLAHVGVVVFFFNPYAVAALCLVLLPAMVVRIGVEERALFSLSGYAEYAERRARLMPLVW